MDPATALALAKIGTDTIGGAFAAGEQRELSEMDMAQQWRQFLLSLGQRASEQQDARGETAARMSSRQAVLPLMDQGFTGLQARFAQGPANFGQTGEFNRQMQNVGANYQPGQNPSMAQYGADLEMLKNRFMERPQFASPEWNRGLAENPGWTRGGGGWRGKIDRQAQEIMRRQREGTA